jgi:hypothetical protein
VQFTAMGYFERLLITKARNSHEEHEQAFLKRMIVAFVDSCAFVINSR